MSPSPFDNTRLGVHVVAPQPGLHQPGGSMRHTLKFFLQPNERYEKNVYSRTASTQHTHYKLALLGIAKAALGRLLRLAKREAPVS